MRILITGATGFIGRNLVEYLAGKGHQLICLVRYSRKKELLKPFGVTFVEGDVTDDRSIEAFPETDVIVHCAALVEEKRLSRLRRVNVGGTANVCRLAFTRGARLVHLSSIAVVSGNSETPVREDAPYEPVNAYGISKMEAEKIVLEYRLRGLRAAIIRPAMVYGEAEPHMFAKIVTLLRHRLIALPEGGKRKLHLVYVKNTCALLKCAIEDDRFLEGSFFSGDEDVLTAAEIAGIICSACDLKPPWSIPGWLLPLILRLPLAGPAAASLCKNRVFDIGRGKALGYRDALAARLALDLSARYFRR